MFNVSWPRLGAPLATAVLAACAGNGQGLDANGRPSPPGGAPAPPLTADFQSIQDNVFTPICVRCHSGAAAPQGLQLDSAHSYALLVGVPSTEAPGILRVKPGDPDNSYLVLKLQGSAGITGAQMPFGGPPLPQATLDVIRQWITDGASAQQPGAASAFVMTASSPPAGAHMHTAPARIVVAFSHEIDASLVNDTTLQLTRLTAAGAAELPGRSTFALAEGNPRAVLLTPAEPLASGRYRLTLRSTGGAGLADVNAQGLAHDDAFEFTVEATP